VKCIRCGTDNNLKDRTANMGRCSSCNHQFVFEPTAMTEVRLTDPFFAKIITDLSANNTLFFTPRQLYYLLDKRLRSKFITTNIATNPFAGIGGGLFLVLFATIILSKFFQISLELIIPSLFGVVAAIAVWTIAENALLPQLNRHLRRKSIKMLGIVAGMILLIGLPVSIIAKTPIGIISSIAIGLSAILLIPDRKRKQSKIFDKFFVEQRQFDEWLNKWSSINNSPEKILPPPQTASLPAAPNPEVTAYSFDRVVVCDSPKIAQLLISNNFHFENNCAILAIDRYPQSIFNTTMEMLSRNPDLKVYALHDCSPQGLQLIRRLRSEEIWFPDSTIPIIDVGVLPRQIMDNIDVMTLQSTGSARLAQQLSPDLRNSLNPAELAWLDAGCYLELESFSPQKLIQILQRAINESRELASIEGGDLLMINAGFYTVESFG
jgi:DNA-directed RNA polymerase subunit RPC12/RpoP